MNNNNNNNGRSNMTNIGLTKEENALKFWVKQICTLFLPFLVVYSELKKMYSRKFAIINSIVGLILFIVFWNGIFSDNTFKTENNQLKANLTSKNDKISSLNRKIDRQANEINNLNLDLEKSIAYGKLTDKQKADMKAKEKAKKAKEKKEKKLAQDKKQKEELKKNYQSWIEKQFSAWDGNCHVMEDEIKKVLNDPDSYKFVDHKFWKQEDHKSIIVKITFTCKNAMGGTVKLVAHGKIIYDKNIIPTTSRVENFELIQ